MADSHHFEISLNRHNSATVSSICTKFGKMTQSHFGHLYPVDHKNSEVLKSKSADGRRFQKPLNCQNSATIQWIATKFGIMTHFYPLKPTHDQNFDLKNLKWRMAAVFEKKSKNRHISATV